MQISPTALSNALHTFLGISFSIGLALRIAQAVPRNKSLPAIAMGAMGGVSAALLLLFSLPQVYMLIPVCLLAGVMLFALHVHFYYCFMAVLLSGLFTELYALLFSCLQLFFPAASLPGYMLDGLFLVAVILCWYLDAAILPEPSSLPAVNSQDQRRPLSVSLLYVGTSVAVMNLWVLFSLCLFPQLDSVSQLLLTALTLLMSVLLLGYARRVAFSVVERIEALIDKQYQNDLLSFMQVIRSQRHDFNFHMRTVSALIEQGQYAACDEYVQQMVKSTSAMNDMLPLYHPATSAIINAFRELALQKGMELEINISSDLAKLPCTVYEINAVIGNLLQNAIDELEQSHSRGPIQLLILFRGGYYIIRVSNPCQLDEATLQEMFRPGFSTKQSHEGLGLAAVRRIANRYDGMVFPEFGQGELKIIVQIPFCA